MLELGNPYEATALVVRLMKTFGDAAQVRVGTRREAVAAILAHRLNRRCLLRTMRRINGESVYAVKRRQRRAREARRG